MDKSRLDLFGIKDESSFLKVILESDTSIKKTALKKSNSTIMQATFRLSSNSVKHEMSMFTVFDLMGDVGGLLDIFTLILGFLMIPFNHTLFLHKTLNKLYKIEA